MPDFSKIEVNGKTYNVKDEYARNHLGSSSILNVEIIKEFDGSYTADYNDNEINNARNNGKVVQAIYFNEVTNQYYTYYYSTMESDRKPTFIRTFIEGNKIIQVLASVGYDKKVDVKRNIVDVNKLIEPVNNEVDLLTGEVSDINQAIDLLQTTDNQIKSQITNLFDIKENKTEIVTNENGTAIKFANGQMIFYNSFDCIFNKEVNKNFVVPFIDSNVTIVISQGYNYSKNSLARISATKTSYSVNLFDTDITNPSWTNKVHIQAFGKWK